ncbi:aspartate aminotransferase family protein [Agromyces sp. H3Y2-19a]|jgi:glutamate/tyrosine decarboxylase-like PLP-dependent enzyme|uniref:pyridoxal phosphate-dependent decarboxylase family protein n=1 Tax=Agromyces TaxID=33877 RepID=UPI001E65E21B|nr:MULTISPECIES: aspartate aminotransferase family protein [Agromyces]MCD5346669.1 aspartate aminotransferase family protein [Agromyces sp. S2-1-8]MDF0513029.1 aspartate aminotransferase family protein [Agromyces chromiiresistens]
MIGFRREASEILRELDALRAADAPTHGGRVLSYVYDSGLDELDELAGRAARRVQPVNGLDPTTFGSVAAMERAVVGFARRVLGGGDGGGADGEVVVGSVTSGGTESCLLAVKSARDAWRAARIGSPRVPRVVAPVTVHAAFHKAAHYFGLELDLVPVDPETGTLAPSAIEERLGDDVALVVVSAPSYPFASLDPVADVAAITAARGIALHVDACIGGFALAFWPEPLPAWNLSVPGVTSISADLHKYGYAPKGASVLLTRGRDRQRRQYFATTGWPGYPVVNPTMTGSKPAGPLAAAWAIIEALGEPGFRDLTAQTARATAELRAAIDGIEGLRVVGEPVGPLLAVAADEAAPVTSRVDPHHWADAAREAGWQLQLQPGLAQADGTRLPHTTHLTVTPVTERVLPELVPALVAAADEVRGIPRIDGRVALAGLAEALPGGVGGALLDAGGTDAAAFDLFAASLDSDAAAAVLSAAGLLGGEGALPDRLAPVLALVEALPGSLTERLLIELLARVVEPT